MSIFTLKLFNTGQITLPKAWRKKYPTKLFLAKETPEGLLIQPIEKNEKNETVYFENKESFGIYCEKGLPVDDIISKIKEIHGAD